MLRHVNVRQPGDPRPDRAYCKFCGWPITREVDSVDWTAGQVGVSGRSDQCPKAPNPDDGPMPGHEPNGVIVHPPAES